MKTFRSESQIQGYIDFRSGMLLPVCLIIFLTVAVGCFWLLWDNAAMGAIERHIEYLKLLSGPNTMIGYWHELQKHHLATPIIFRFVISISAGVLAAILFARPWFARPDKLKGLQVLDGYEVYEEAKQGLQAMRKKAGVWQKKGIQIYRGIGGCFRMPYELEAKHMIFLGSVGSGKTASMLHGIQSIVGRGDKAVIYDYKGDLTEWLGGQEGVSILGFADARSAPWHIARDINTPLLARELAQTIIEETSEPVWGNNARDVLSGCIEYLIVTKPNTWGFKDIADLLNSERQHVVKCLREINHGAANTIDKPKDDKGAASVMSTLRSGAWIFDVLGKAWGNPCKGFSIHDWLHDESPEQRIIILRNYPEISAVSNWLLYIIFNQMFGEVLALPDSKKRRVWAIIDELATLPAMPRLEECLVASRSKGFRFMCGIQNFSSMREKYGSNVAQTLLSQFATRVICRVMDSDTANALARDMGGERLVKRGEVKQIETLDETGDKKRAWDVIWKESTESTMRDSQITNLPDPTENNRVVAWLYMAGFPICKLQWKFLKTEATAKRDEPVKWLDEAKHEQDTQASDEVSADKPEQKEQSCPKDEMSYQPRSEDVDFENLEDFDEADFEDIE